MYMYAHEIFMQISQSKNFTRCLFNHFNISCIAMYMYTYNVHVCNNA